MQATEQMLEMLKGEVQAASNQMTHAGAQIEHLKSQEAVARLKYEALLETYNQLETEVAAEAEAKALEDSQLALNGSPSHASTGFRDEIRAILGGSAKGLRPRDITAELKKRKFEYTAKTEMSLRVANELHRMMKAGHIRKRGKLYYAPL